MNKAISSGAVRQLTEKELKYWSGPSYFLVHFPVLKPGSESTPLRIVANSALRNCFSGLSLNQCMEAGPNALTDLTQVLLKWCSFKEVLLYNLSKAYQSLITGEQEMHMRKFYWRESNNIPWKVFAFPAWPGL